MPQALEFKVQTASRRAGWPSVGQVAGLEQAAESFRSAACEARVTGRCPSNTSFDPLYRDGWTVTGGVGHAFNDKFSGAVSPDLGSRHLDGFGLPDRHCGHFAAGGAYKPTENIEFRLGGSLGLLAERYIATTRARRFRATAVTYTFGDDLVAAISRSVKVKW